MIRYLISASALIVFASPVCAQTKMETDIVPPAPPVIEDKDHTASKVTGIVALGGGIVPKFEGSGSYRIVPAGLALVRWQDVDFALTGPTLRVDLTGGKRFQFGPVIGLSGSRSAKDAAGPVKHLDPIGDSASYGLFAGVRLGGNMVGKGAVTVTMTATRDTRRKKGAGFDAGVSYAAIRNMKSFATIDVAADFGDAKYARTFFGVTEAEAAASGLEAYRPGSGLTKISVGVTSGYQLSHRWGIIGRLQGGSYTGDAANSPIVENGSSLFGAAVLGISYTL